MQVLSKNIGENVSHVALSSFEDLKGKPNTSKIWHEDK